MFTPQRAGMIAMHLFMARRLLVEVRCESVHGGVAEVILVEAVENPNVRLMRRSLVLLLYWVSAAVI